MDSFRRVFYVIYRLLRLFRGAHDVNHEQLAVCAYAEGWSPKRETRHYVGMRIAPLAVAMALLKEMVSEEV